VRPFTAFLLGAVAATLLVFGGLADRALVEQGRIARQAVEAGAAEAARLTAFSVRATLAQIEQDVVAGHASDDVRAERLAQAPGLSAPRPGTVPYGRRPRSELAQLLHSTGSTNSGLPEAVVARIALGDAAVSLGGAETPPDVGDRLLSGHLPVNPDDLPYLARALGIANDPRMPDLQRRLRVAHTAGALPAVPGFRRRVTGRGTIEGWARTGEEQVHYEVGVRKLLVRAGVADRATPAGSANAGHTTPVPDVDGFSLAVNLEVPGALRLKALRVVLWAAVIASALGLFGVKRGLDREARATAREKAFLASVTHELRTPLAAIRVFGETLAQGRGDPRDYGTLVAQETERLEALVERVLAVTRVDEAPAYAPVRPAVLARSAIALIAPRAERRAVTVEWVGDDVPEVEWDAEAVRRALLNLLDNAIQHGRERGHVEVRAVEQGGLVRLSVTDDGPGIGAAHRKGVFDRFRRGPTEGPGTGLGLYLVEQVARAHGGRVDLETEEARGSTFTLVLPVVPPGATAAAPRGGTLS